ncbi:MAG: hypothetical protein H0V01_09625 [Bacteroidetes bacterium]|nr:hypothetical protein [Bacteroidota bacterium]HET6242999.1 hypothetical protein [Bacteroidia bacterium]
MDRLFDVLIAVLPSLVVFLTAFYIIKRFIDNEQKRHWMEIKGENQKSVTPIRLQAYERIAIFLERIAPSSLIIRSHKTGMSARTMQSELLKTIRSEYEHNVAQQIYMSSSAWKAIKSAKEETIKLINIASTKISDDASGTELGRVILELSGQLEQTPSDFALDFIKREIKALF